MVTRRALLRGSSALAVGLALPRRSRAGLPERPAFRLPLPARSPGAATGSDFAHRVESLSDEERYGAAGRELLSGNVPDFMRQLVPVTMAAPAGDSGPREVVFWVTPDYLAIGADRDYLRIPLDFPTASAVALAWGFALPTPHMVDAIYQAAGCQLAPAPLPPGPMMRSVPYVLHHQELIELARAGVPLGTLTAGHKKDVVLTGRLRQHRDRVAIYGWHRPDGHPIQPVSLVHGAGYADYSHGIRLVYGTVLADGAPVDLYDALADPSVGSWLAADGPLDDAPELMHPADTHG